MINIDKVSSGNGYRFVILPNCSISWPQLVAFYLLTCVLALGIGLLFFSAGMWLVLPFSGLEMLALGTALYLTSRKVHRREVITLDSKRVVIEKGVSRVDQSWEFETVGTRLIDEKNGAAGARRKLVLGARGKYVEIGEFLDNLEKDELAFRLKDCIIRV